MPVDEAWDNLWTSRSSGVCEAVHSLWIPLGILGSICSEQGKVFPQDV
jgi:hypothetical protein